MLANITGDWPWVLVVVLVLFGGSQLPKLAKNAGEAMKEFRKAHNDVAGPFPGVTSTPAPAPAVATLPASVPPVVEASSPSTVPPAAGPASANDELVTLTRAQLDAILGTRPAQERGPSPDGTSA